MILCLLAIILAAEITQVIDSIPWVHCASGNVFHEDWMDDNSNVQEILFETGS